MKSPVMQPMFNIHSIHPEEKQELVKSVNFDIINSKLPKKEVKRMH